MRFFPWTNVIDPLSLSPSIWFGGGDGNNFYDATSGGSNTAADGNILRWNDLSGNTRNATQGTSGKYPIRKAAFQNGRDVALFDGSNDFLATAGFTGTETWTRWLVCATTSQLNYVVMMAWGSAFNTPNPGADYLGINLGKMEAAQNGGPATTNLTSKTASSVNMANNEFVIIEQSCDGTNSGNLITKNGASFSQTNPFTGNPGTFSKVSTAYGIGAYSGGTSTFAGYIGEILHVPGVVTAGTKAQVRALLGSRWNISTV